MSGTQFVPHRRKLVGCSFEEASYPAVLYVDGLSSTYSLPRAYYQLPIRSVCVDYRSSRSLTENLKIANTSLVMSSPSTTASSIPTTPTTPFSLPSPVPFDATMTPMQISSSSMPFLALPPPVVRPRRYALHPSFKLQPPPISLKTRTTIIEEQEDEDGCTKIEIHVPTITSSLAFCHSANKTFADAVAGRNPPEPAPAPIASSSTMTFGDKLSGQPRSTRAGARTHRRAQSISMSVSDSVGLSRRKGTGSDAHEQVLMAPRRPSSLTPSPRMVHFETIPEAESDSPRASLHPRAAAHPRVSALAPPHPGLRSATYGLAPPSRFASREESTPRALVNSGRIIALPSFEDDAFTSMKGSSSYAFGTNPVAIAIGRGFEQWGQ
ncbi:hypothetical protein RHS01_01520 [Rhizoctonia solani]|uniref:Uncharacterized protein n=1 Tax=Rhizoctonia solani TaxID=456999 RepID=A0A8H7IKG8_9AGAM|nr:hypothetical protein RHS01_01520 [Rhizoctonia solani]